MRSWIGIVALFAGAILVALLLRVAPPLLVLVALGGVSWVVFTRVRARIRGEGITGQAQVLGLRQEAEDPFGLLQMPLALFGRGTDPAIERLLWGTWRGLEVRQFTYAYALDGSGAERRRFVCAIGSLGVRLPQLVAEPESFVMRLGAAPSPVRVALDPGAVGRTFSVWCDDDAFARVFVDDRMAAWLGELGDDWGFEVHGPVAMVYGMELRRPDVLSVLQTLGDLLARIPPGVLESFGTAPAPGEVANGPRPEDAEPAAGPAPG